MRSVAEITRMAHAYGFERGSFITLQTVMAWLDANGGSSFAAGISDASNDGSLEKFRPPRSMTETPEPTPELASTVIIDPVLPTDVGPARMSFEQAKGSGYTGNQCGYCSSMRMTISGHCEKCEDCGESSGCS